jgi:hypothetical protein
MSESIYAFHSEGHPLYGWGTPEEAERFAAIMRTARPYEIEPLNEADLAELPLGERILRLAISLEEPL